VENLIISPIEKCFSKRLLLVKTFKIVINAHRLKILKDYGLQRKSYLRNIIT
jgi:hypothetical protein